MGLRIKKNVSGDEQMCEQNATQQLAGPYSFNVAVHIAVPAHAALSQDTLKAYLKQTLGPFAAQRGVQVRVELGPNE